MARYWYAFIPPGAGAQPQLNPVNYRLANPSDSVPPGCNLVGGQICSIYAPAGDITPDSPFSTNLTNYITQALSSSAAKPSTGQVFVYVKPNA